MRRGLAAVALAGATGCAQLLGLEETTFEPGDSGIDAPGVCDGAPACTSTTGRSLCGQLFGTGDRAGQPLRVAAPTGGACAPGSLEGPCAFTVGALPKASLFASLPDGRVEGTVDDCGRFVVPDVDPSLPDVAVVVSGTDQHTTASLVLGRPPEVGEDRGIRALGVTSATVLAWGAQLRDPPVDAATGYLVEYTNGGNPVLGDAVAKDSGSPLTNPFGTVPWAAYFTGFEPFGVLDPTLTVTANSGSALVVPGGGIFSIDGFRTGRRCKISDLQQVTNTLVHIVQVDC